MAQPSARRIALKALRAWRRGKRFADSIISQRLGKAGFTRRDRAFTLELFYGVLRNITLLDFWIGCLRTSRIDDNLCDILRLGLYQLFFLRTAQHAAVFETVALAPKKQRAVINGMLRAAARRREELRNQADTQPLFVRTSHPQFLVARWRQHLGDKNAEDLCNWNNLPPPVYGRVNQLKIDPKNFLRLYPESSLLAGNPDFVEFRELPAKALDLGHCYIQDPSTAIACQFLDPKAGHSILDACAAPGGKTGYIAELMQNQGIIVACDRDSQRLKNLKDNVARLDARIIHAVRHDWTCNRLQEEIASVAPFDRILVDAPCTNTGVMRRRVDLRWRLRPEDFTRMPNEQFVITLAASRLLKAGGVLVYSTCSLEPEENEQVVGRILAEMPNLRLEAERYSLPFCDCFDGAYIARLVRNG
jgi:16S rRNA (cytosine967-C5)-methyltransferase